MRPEALFEQARDGNEQAFVALLDRFEQPVFSYFRRRGVQRVDAEDLTQQVFIALLESAGRFDARRGSLRSLLFGIARRMWLKHVASLARRPADVPDEIADDKQTPPGAAMDLRLRQARVAEAIALLPGAAREVLVLRVHHNLSLQEIGEVLEMPVNTVKSHLFRARQRLREDLEATWDTT